MAAAHPAVEKNGEASLLAVVETVVEGLRGGGEFLQVGGAGAQLLRGAGQPVDGIDLVGLVVVSILTPLPPGGEPGRAFFREIAHRRFEGRPVLLLVSVQFEPGLERGDPRVEEGGAVLGTETT